MVTAISTTIVSTTIEKVEEDDVLAFDAGGGKECPGLIKEIARVSVGDSADIDKSYVYTITYVSIDAGGYEGRHRFMKGLKGFKLFIYVPEWKPSDINIEYERL